LFNLVTGATPIDLFAVDATSTRWRRLPPGLAPIVARATSYEVGDRYQTAQQMAFALLAVIDQVGATPVPVDPRAEPSWGPGAASLPPDPLATRDAITFLMSPGATRARPEATGSTLADVRAPTLDGETPLEEVEPASPPEVVEPQPAETTPTTAVVEPDPTPEPDIAEGPPPAALDAWERQRGARRHEREQAIWMAAVALMAIALLGAGGIAALEWMVGGLGKDRVATPDVVAQVPLPADPVGTWVGSLDHSDLTLVLRGSPEHLEGDVLVQTSGQERRQQVTGHYDPTTRMLTLHDVGGGLVRATLSADTERLDGTWGATDGSAARSLRATRAP